MMERQVEEEEFVLFIVLLSILSLTSFHSGEGGLEDIQL